jgi:hypothetical protein
MTDDLVQRLKGHSEIMERDKGKVVRFIDVATCTEAVDRIEALTAENERLRDYWYRQGKDDQHQVDADRIEAQAAEIERLNKSAECLAETRRLAVKDVAEIEAENERLREALEFYAEAKNWAYVKSAGCNCIDADGGDTARAALEQTKW